MPQFDVSSDALSGGGATLAQRVADFEARVASTRAVVTGLLGGAWTGSAADTFSAGWVEWDEGASEVREALAGISRLLGGAAMAYVDTEDDVTAVSTGSGVTYQPKVSPYRLPPVGGTGA